MADAPQQQRKSKMYKNQGAHACSLHTLEACCGKGLCVCRVFRGTPVSRLLCCATRSLRLGDGKCTHTRARLVSCVYAGKVYTRLLLRHRSPFPKHPFKKKISTKMPKVLLFRRAKTKQNTPTLAVRNVQSRLPWFFGLTWSVMPASTSTINSTTSARRIALNARFTMKNSLP